MLALPSWDGSVLLTTCGDRARCSRDRLVPPLLPIETPEALGGEGGPIVGADPLRGARPPNRRWRFLLFRQQVPLNVQRGSLKTRGQWRDAEAHQLEIISFLTEALCLLTLFLFDNEEVPCWSSQKYKRG